MSRWWSLLPVVLLAAGQVAADVPRGRPPARPRPTHVVVQLADLQAPGVTARVAPGVPVSIPGPRRGLAGKLDVTLAGDAELSGRMAASALGVRVLREVELRDVRGRSVVGRARAGTLVRLIGDAGGVATIEPVAGVNVRMTLPSEAAGADPVELVLPVPEGQLASTAARIPLRAGAGPRDPVLATLDAGVRLDVLARSGDVARVRTYGGLEIEGHVPVSALAGEAPVPSAPSKGLGPTHEALLDTPVFADAAGRRRAGALRGGALVTVGVERAGSRVRVMTHGDVVAELWVDEAELRPLDATVLSEGP